MRITVTVDQPERQTDVLVDCDDATPLGAVVAAVVAEAGGSAASVAENGATLLGSPILNGSRFNGAEVTPQQTPAVAGLQLHVVGGPDSGLIFDLPVGSHEIGRSASLSWNDTSLSRRHVRVEVSPTSVTVTDLGSSNGSRIEGKALAASVAESWNVGEILEIGDSLVALRQAQPADATVEAVEPGWLNFLRPPRIVARYAQPTVVVPTAPELRNRRKFPLIALILPLVMGIGLALMMHQMTFLAFAVMSPVMMGANYISDRRGDAKDFKKASADYEAALAAAQVKLTQSVETEQTRLRTEQPDAAATLLTALRPGRRLWERRRYDSDFLSLRVGTADSATTVKVTGGDGAHELRMIPQAISLTQSAVVGLAGPEELTDGLLRWLIAQMATYHAPRDLSVRFLSLNAGDEWRWLQWLPQTRPEDVDASIAAIGNDSETVAAQTGALVELIRARKAALADQHGLSADSFPAVVVVMREYRTLRPLPGIASIITDGPSVGVYSLCTDSSERTLPERANAVVVIGDEGPALLEIRVSGADPVRSVLAECVSTPWADRLARGIAPLRDVSPSEGSEALPDSARLLDILSLDPPRGDDLRLRWGVEPRSTQMIIGQGLNGPFRLDLRSDGPHGLIAGMTGSGKTELLQTMIAALAVANRPEWLNFVLIDYKGDSAFKDCVHLPHTVGKVNDLDPFLVERALASLTAELDVRKNQLAAAAVKDIDDYHDLLAKEPHRAPMPRLLLVIDEFAELAKELPDFMDGLVSIAQVGRSLGVHLLLATQRPSGVVSPSIRANTNMRIALRVADSADSTDVLNSPEAAKIPKSAPGRAFARLSGSELVPFQAGRVGGRRPGAVALDLPKPFVCSIGWHSLGYAPPRRPVMSAESDVSKTDLAALVEAVKDAADLEGIPAQRKPWLEPLPVQADLLEREMGQPSGGVVPPLPFGLSDLPAAQEQRDAEFDLIRDGHLYVIGSAQSGRSQLLRTLAGSVAVFASPNDVHLYGLDCGNGALNPLTALPHCGAVVSRNEEERAGRLLARLMTELDSRHHTFASHGYGDIAEQRRNDTQPLPHIVLMLDRWETFTTTLGENQANTDAVMRILREGASAGVHLVITGDRSLVTNSRLSAMTENKFTLRLADRGDFMLVGISPKKVPDKLAAGRGFGPGMVETQVYLLGKDASGQGQAVALQRLGMEAHARLESSGGQHTKPFRLDALPSRISTSEALALSSSSGVRLVLGVGGDELNAQGPDVSVTSAFVVAGPPRSGRSTVLLAAAQSALATGGQLVVVASDRSPLRSLHSAPGVLGIFSEEVTGEELEKSIATGQSGIGTILVVDDGRREAAAADVFARVARGSMPGVFLLVSGQPEQLSIAFSGWPADVKKAGQGLLLSPQNLTDGDLIGTRVPRGFIGAAIVPGRGFLHLGDGQLLQVTTLTPETAAESSGP